MFRFSYHDSSDRDQQKNFATVRLKVFCACNFKKEKKGKGKILLRRHLLGKSNAIFTPCIPF